MNSMRSRSLKSQGVPVLLKDVLVRLHFDNPEARWPLFVTNRRPGSSIDAGAPSVAGRAVSWSALCGPSSRAPAAAAPCGAPFSTSSPRLRPALATRPWRRAAALCRCASRRRPFAASWPPGIPRGLLAAGSGPRWVPATYRPRFGSWNQILADVARISTEDELQRAVLIVRIASANPRSERVGVVPQSVDGDASPSAPSSGTVVGSRAGRSGLGFGGRPAPGVVVRSEDAELPLAERGHVEL